MTELNEILAGALSSAKNNRDLKVAAGIGAAVGAVMGVGKGQPIKNAALGAGLGAGLAGLAWLATELMKNDDASAVAKSDATSHGDSDLGEEQSSNV